MTDYATHTDVEETIPDMAKGGVFSASTIPTDTTVDKWVNQVEGEFNSRLKSHGYTAPIVVGTNPEAFDWATRAITARVCVLVLNTKPGLSFDGDNPSPLSNRKAGFQFEWQTLLDMIADETFQTERVVNRAERLRVGSATTTEGETKDPVFSRGMWDYPGGPGASGRTSPGV